MSKLIGACCIGMEMERGACDGKEETKAIADGIIANPGSKHKAEPLLQLGSRTKMDMKIR
jgi:hypothetical protein